MISLKKVVILAAIYIGHLALSAGFIFMAGMQEFGQAFGDSANPLFHIILWVWNTPLMIVMAIFNEGEFSMSSADPYFRHKQILYSVSFFLSSFLVVLAGWFLHRRLSR